MVLLFNLALWLHVVADDRAAVLLGTSGPTLATYGLFVVTPLSMADFGAVGLSLRGRRLAASQLALRP